MLIILCKHCLMKTDQVGNRKFTSKFFKKLLLFWLEPVISNIDFMFPELKGKLEIRVYVYKDPSNEILYFSVLYALCPILSKS